MLEKVAIAGVGLVSRSRKVHRQSDATQGAFSKVPSNGFFFFLMSTFGDKFLKQSELEMNFFLKKISASPFYLCPTYQFQITHSPVCSITQWNSE
jgi:hypothetical protein